MDLRKAETLALQLMAQHGLCADPTWDFAKRNGWAGSNPRSWTFSFDDSYRRFGVCRLSQRKIGLSRKLVALNDEHEVRDTILHEIAHALAPRGAHHGPAWKAVCVRIGAKPVRCYSSDDVTTVAAKWQGTCPTCGKVWGRLQVPRGVYSCKCRPRYLPFTDPRYAIKFARAADVVVQARGEAHTAAPVPALIRTWFHGQYLPTELVQALQEENVKTITQEQIAHIQRVQQERGISYKSAVQYIRRNLGGLKLQDWQPGEHNPPVALPVPAVLEIPIAPGISIKLPIEPPPAPAPTTQDDVAGFHGTGMWNPATAATMYAAGGKLIDIAEAMGYARGKGQTRVRRALEVAGVWQGAH